jgi:hypothetical protein
MHFFKQRFKKSLIALLVWTPFLGIGQNLERCGINTSPFVTENEALFLNRYLKAERLNFDFRGKKIAVVTGSSGMVVQTKRDYFDAVKANPKTGDGKIATFCIFLTELEKQESGGYDVVLAEWVKAHPQSKKLIKKLAQTRRE